MKKILSIVAILSVVLLVSCGGSSSFSLEKCQQLEEKIKAQEPLSESDYNEMIDQVVAASKTLKEKEDACDGDPEKLSALKADPEIKDLMQYAVGFMLYLGFNEQELTPGNLKKLQQAQKEFEKMKD